MLSLFIIELPDVITL